MPRHRDRNSEITVQDSQLHPFCPTCGFNEMPGTAATYCRLCGDTLVTRAVLFVTCGCTPERIYRLDSERFCPACGTGFHAALTEQGIDPGPARR